MTRASLRNEAMVDIKQFKLTEDFIRSSALCVVELVCVSLCYITKPNDSNVLLYFISSCVSETK